MIPLPVRSALVQGVICLLLTGRFASAQDTLFFQRGDYLLGKIMKITPTKIEYKHLNRPEGPVVLVNKTEVKKIVFENGTIEIFEELPVGDYYAEEKSKGLPAPVVRATPAMVPAEAYRQGSQAARRYYRGYGPMWATAGVSSVFPPAGLLTGGILALSRPNINAIQQKNPEMANNPSYLEGYVRTAKRRKFGKTAAGFGIGTGIFVAIVTFLTPTR